MIGICAAAATYRFTVMFAVPLIAAALGTVVSFVLIRQVASGLMAQIVVAAIGGVAAGAISFKFGKEIRVLATATIGAILVVFGVEFYYERGTYDAHTHEAVQMPLAMAIGTFVVTMALGVLVQSRTFTPEDETFKSDQPY